MADLQLELALFRQQSDSNLEALRTLIANNHVRAELKLQAELATFRDVVSEKFAQERMATDESVQRCIDELTARADRLENKVDFLTKWMVASQVTIE